MSDAPPEVRALAERRAAARDARDFTAADDLRAQLAEAGWTVTDGPTGWRLEPSDPTSPARLRAGDVGSALQEPVAFDATLTWVTEGWPEDIDRSLASFRSTAGDRRLQFVVADVTGERPDRWGTDVEVLPLELGTGWAAARNAALRRARGRIVLVVDGSVEATGDALGRLDAALADPSVGVCGPFGLVTEDLREFRRIERPGACDAVEAYLMAVRRETVIGVGGFDERFEWYRSADLEWSFRVREAGLRVVMVPAPVTVHEHRAWASTPKEDRESRSRRNYARFLDRWRGRWDLTVRGRPPDAP